MSRGRVTAPKPARNREGNLRLACAAFRYSVQWSNCVGGPKVVSPLSLVLGSGSAWLWESPAIGLRVARGPMSMNKTTHTASSHGASPRVEIHPPVERAAPMSGDAPPPVGLLREGSWGSASSGDDDVMSNATSGSNDPGWPEPHPQGAHGHDHPQGLDVAAWAAASPVGSQSTGALRSASTGNVEANHISYQPNGSGGLVEADPWGAYLETDRGLDTAAWAARSAVGSPLWGAPGNAPAGDAEANYTTMGSDDPPRAWAPGAPDRDGSASVASQVRIRTAGAHAPVGMHVAHDAKEALGAGYDPRHEPQGQPCQTDHGTSRRSPSSSAAYARRGARAGRAAFLRGGRTGARHLREGVEDVECRAL